MKSKTFQPHDHGLWDEVRRTISPLQRRAAQAALAQDTTSAPLPHARISTDKAQHVVPTASAPRLQPPPLAAFDRRMAQRLTRGQLEPEARIDLHGDGLEIARIKLLHFLQSQRQQGNRLVLVITGKGASPFGRHTLHGAGFYHSPEREGRLRREVPIWLHEAPFRMTVAGFQPAHPRHGGGGAFYLRLRRNSE
jgi:DNA-nicking Smr family endonuclease